ncbi:AAA family ATPase [Spiroplasma turonicum]|uniref:Putative exodeoxyribonuclease V alpha subunit n=1 Tax=Spiroplasma turonicum TaxID=216946 RepID=A0A0K1P6E0_9MOLU|nr:AAA family ATPase [Spiroplasma turonicum]AKU79850.1 putative exodeoxyribonuclease V alpha subunit [Spiroplasma turonicum]ALX70867.1 hypothetical protein STURO_v1c06020 [Spiroplasma turonicum]
MIKWFLYRIESFNNNDKNLINKENNDVLLHFLKNSQKKFKNLGIKILSFFHLECLNFNILTTFFNNIEIDDIDYFKSKFVSSILERLRNIDKYIDVTEYYSDIFDCLISLKLNLNVEKIKHLYFILNIYKSCSENGDLYLKSTELMKLLDDTYLKDVRNLITDCIENNYIKKVSTNSNKIKYYPYIYYLYEYEISKKIKQILKQEHINLFKNDWEYYAKNFNIANLNILTEEQVEVLKSYIKNKIIIINGRAGTGKTTVIKSIVDLTKKVNPSCEIKLCALSGMAASNIKTKIGDEYNINSLTLYLFLFLMKQCLIYFFINLPYKNSLYIDYIRNFLFKLYT